MSDGVGRTRNVETGNRVEHFDVNRRRKTCQAAFQLAGGHCRLPSLDRTAKSGTVTVALTKPVTWTVATPADTLDIDNPPPVQHSVWVQLRAAQNFLCGRATRTGADAGHSVAAL